MKNEAILKKAIKKAIKGGFLSPNDKRYKNPFKLNDIYKYEAYDQLKECWIAETNRGSIMLGSINEIIFSHDFAKAFWGEDWHFNIGYTDRKELTICDKCGGDCPWLEKEPDEFHSAWIFCWQANLLHMVLEEERLKYIAQFI